MGGKALRSIGLTHATLHLNWKVEALQLAVLRLLAGDRDRRILPSEIRPELQNLGRGLKKEQGNSPAYALPRTVHIFGAPATAKLPVI